jgi:uncharacterized protein (TIGR03118 family)
LHFINSKKNFMHRISFKKAGFLQAVSAAVVAMVIISGCKKEISTTTADEPVSSLASRRGDDEGGGIKSFNIVNLVANNANYGAATIDPTLKNGWGIAWSAGGTAWVNSQGGHVSELYNGEGVKAALTVNIPSPAGNEGGNPTGIIFNANAADFVIPSGNTTAATGARFIFVGLDGIVSGWNPSWANHAFTKFNQVGVSVYTGLAIAANGGSNFLYAADFKGRKIKVWDKTWAPVAMSFTDRRLPRGYAPFNIQEVGGRLYVTYAKVGSDGRSMAGRGLGIVNIFTTAGVFVKRFADGDKLNAPWGITMAAASFFPPKMIGHDDDDDDDDDDHHGNDRHGHDDNDTTQPKILVGNFGDGRINVYSLDGDFIGQLRSRNRVISIDKLWAIGFAPTTSPIDQRRLYFAAGPNNELDGLFGYIIKDL